MSNIGDITSDDQRIPGYGKKAAVCSVGEYAGDSFDTGCALEARNAMPAVDRAQSPILSIRKDKRR